MGLCLYISLNTCLIQFTYFILTHFASMLYSVAKSTNSTFTEFVKNNYFTCKTEKSKKIKIDSEQNWRD